MLKKTEQIEADINPFIYSGSYLFKTSVGESYF